MNGQADGVPEGFPPCARGSQACARSADGAREDTCPGCGGAGGLPTNKGSKLWSHGWAGVRCPDCNGTGFVRVTVAEHAASLRRNTTFVEARAIADSLRDEVAKRAVALSALREGHEGPMGLTSDAVKFSPAYREAKAAYDAAFARLRSFNQIFTKAFRAELRAERQARSVRQ